jgi:adenosylhomocysteine nucleosidase
VVPPPHVRDYTARLVICATPVRFTSVRAVVALVAVALPSLAPAQTVVGVLGITQEITPIEKRLQDPREITVQGMVFRTGKLNGRSVVVGRSGTGKVYAAIAATVLITHFKPSALFFSGTAGGVDPELGLGDVVFGTSVAQHDFGQQTADGLRRGGPRNPVTQQIEPVFLPAPAELVAAARQAIAHVTLPRVKTDDGERTTRIVEGVIVTGDVFVADAGQREELRKSLGAKAVEMEGAALIQTCRQFAVPCLVVRSITDRADGRAMASYQLLRAQASENAAAFVVAIIGRLGDGAR